MTCGKLLGSAQTNCSSGQRTASYLGLFVGSWNERRKLNTWGKGMKICIWRANVEICLRQRCGLQLEQDSPWSWILKGCPKFALITWISRPLPPFVFRHIHSTLIFQCLRFQMISLWLLCPVQLTKIRHHVLKIFRSVETPEASFVAKPLQVCMISPYHRLCIRCSDWKWAYKYE